MRRLLPSTLLVVVHLASGLFVCTPVLAQTGMPGNSRPHVIWSRTVKRPLGMAVTPDSKFSATIDRLGALNFYDGAGKRIWTKDANGATGVSIAGNGTILLTYAPLNPLHRRLNIVTADGRVRWSRVLLGCVWSAAVSADGTTAVVGTGNRRVYIFSLGKHRLSYRRRMLPGIPFSLAFTPDGQSLVVGMWQRSGVGIFDLQGKPRWWSTGFADLQYTAEISRNGQYILGHGQPNRPQPKDILALWKVNSVRLWQKRMRFEDVNAALLGAGDMVAVSYRHQIAHGKQEMSEQRLALFDSRGRKVWEKGGMFLKPSLLAVLPAGRMLVSSQNSLFLLDRQGRTLSKQPLPGFIRQFVRAPGAGRILMYCGDGRLYMFGQ